MSVDEGTDPVEEFRGIFGMFLGMLNSIYPFRGIIAHLSEILNFLGTAIPFVVALGTGSVAPVMDVPLRARKYRFSHRVMFRVEKEENWYYKANLEFVGEASNCEELPRAE